MNIKEAKEQIKNAMTAYFTKDERGNFILPIESQRPIFLIGPPGIGKTAIMEQIAYELGVGLLSYSMTHHTRQSALGLPFINKKLYGEKEYSVSEYTMSEIIASVYDIIEQTGVKEGILFLDEINCVSETLSPIMLQFLQYKIFGKHKVPDGWVIVTAGNPTEYNNSAKDFDIATWDRLKKIEIIPDYKIWREYALNKQVHSSILTYLDIKPSNFYSIETTIDGKEFVTARGWDDLSKMIKLYELQNIPVNENLIEQYIQNKKISKEFSVYYDLFNKYKSDYKIDAILNGEASNEIKTRAKNAKFDERLSLIGLLLDAVTNSVNKVIFEDNVIQEIADNLREYKLNNKISISNLIEKIKKDVECAKKSGSKSKDDVLKKQITIDFLSELNKIISSNDDKKIALKKIKEQFDKKVEEHKKLIKETSKVINNMIIFLDQIFGDGNELVIVITELTSHKNTSLFLSSYGSEEYFKHNKTLLFTERHKEIDNKLHQLGFN